jgi:hypothetical protein
MDTVAYRMDKYYFENQIKIFWLVILKISFETEFP